MNNMQFVIAPIYEFDARGIVLIEGKSPFSQSLGLSLLVIQSQ